MGDRWTVVDNSQKKGKRLWWLKLSMEFFSSDIVIKKMRKLPGGDTYTIITERLLLMSLPNDFRIYYEGVEDTFIDEIALRLDETPEAVSTTIAMLVKQGWMVKEDSFTYYVPKAEELAGSERDDAERKRRQREREKAKLLLLECDNVTPESHDCHENVTTEKEKSKRRAREESESEEMQEGIGNILGLDLFALCPEAFSEDWEPADPSLEDVRSYALTNRFTDITAEDFFGTFSPSWTEGERRITNWKALYLRLELLSRQGWERE